MYYENRVDFKTLVSKVLVGVEETDDTLTFTTTDNETFILYHAQDCCESVYIESIVGDLEDLIGRPILVAEEVESEDCKPLSEYENSYTWTFYKLDTAKGGVTIRFYGSSNGYYSESVSFAKIQ